jgi:hypothetical protein
MAPNASSECEAHPAPHRDRVTLAGLFFAVLAPPIVWSTHLILNFAFSIHACYPGHAPRFTHLDWLRTLLIVVDLVSMAVAIAAAVVALRSWRTTAREMAETGSPLLEIGEGRTRFLAAWGLIIAVGFLIAVLFDFVGLWVLPICG